MNTTSEELFSLLQLSDSFFPIGGYSLSFGLETFSQRGLLKRGSQVASLLSTLLEQLSTTDGPALRAAYAAAEKADTKRVASIDRRLASFKNVSEFFDASTRTGRALLRTVMAFAPSSPLRGYSRLVELRSVPGTYPVCLALVCQGLGIGIERTVLLMNHTLMVSVLGAGIRLGHLTHLEAQRILHSSKKDLQMAAERSSKVPWEQMRTFAPLLEIMGMQHVYLPAKMFSC
jgi:urease accessory protein